MFQESPVVDKYVYFKLPLVLLSLFMHTEDLQSFIKVYNLAIYKCSLQLWKNCVKFKYCAFYIAPFILDQFMVLASVGNDELAFKARMDNLKITITQTLYQWL